MILYRISPHSLYHLQKKPNVYFYNNPSIFDHLLQPIISHSVRICAHSFTDKILLAEETMELYLMRDREPNR